MVSTSDRYPQWANTLWASKTDAIYDGSVTFHAVAGELGSWLFRRGIGWPTSPWEGFNFDEVHDEPDREKKGQSRQRGRGKKRALSSCDACQKDGHYWKDCYIMWPELAPEGHQTAHRRHREAVDRMTGDPELRKQYRSHLKKENAKWRALND